MEKKERNILAKTLTSALQRSSYILYYILFEDCQLKLKNDRNVSIAVFSNTCIYQAFRN